MSRTLEDRHLMGPERSLHGEAVDKLGSGPPFRCAQDDRRPARPQRLRAAPRRRLDLADPVIAGVERMRELLMHLVGVVTTDEVDFVAVRVEETPHVGLGCATEHRGSADLVSVELQDRQHGAVAARVEEAHAFPRALEGTGLSLAVADDAGRDQVRIVKYSAERMDERVAELATLVDRSGRRGADVARDAARSRELTHEAEQTRFVERDVRDRSPSTSLRDRRWPRWPVRRVLDR